MEELSSITLRLMDKDEYQVEPDDSIDTEDEYCISLSCINGDVSMSKDTLNDLLDASNILKYLIYGHPGMSKEQNYYIFKQYSIRKEVLTILIHCIKTNKYPMDRIAKNILESGELRDASIRIGGFDIIDSIIEEREEREEKEKIGKEENYHRICLKPQDDIENIYEWVSIRVIIPHYNTIIQDYQKDGYKYTITDEYFHHFKRQMVK